MGFPIRYIRRPFPGGMLQCHMGCGMPKNLFVYFYLKLEVKDMLVKTASLDFPLLKWQRSIIILRVNKGTGRQAGPHAVSVSFLEVLLATLLHPPYGK